MNGEGKGKGCPPPLAQPLAGPRERSPQGPCSRADARCARAGGRRAQRVAFTKPYFTDGLGALVRADGPSQGPNQLAAKLASNGELTELERQWLGAAASRR
jgi:ABC-type amino acid transport substrate-binding protein